LPGIHLYDRPRVSPIRRAIFAPDPDLIAA
jgi:hypothetical protein